MFCRTAYRLDKTRLHIPKKLCEPLQAPQRVRHAVNQLSSFYSTDLKDVEEFILSTFPGKDPSKEMSTQRLWNSFANAVVESIHKPDRV